MISDRLIIPRTRQGKAQFASKYCTSMMQCTCPQEKLEHEFSGSSLPVLVVEDKSIIINYEGYMERKVMFWWFSESFFISNSSYFLSKDSRINEDQNYAVATLRSVNAVSMQVFTSR